MAFEFGSLFSSGALGGAGSGAMTGGMLGGPWGALAGGALGLLGGAGAESERRQAERRQKAAMEEAQRMLAELQTKSFQQRQYDANRAMSFFNPVVSRANAYTGFQVNDPGPKDFFGGGTRSGWRPGA